MRLRAGNCGAVGGIDIAVIGMSVNEKKNLTVPPSEAFGERDPALIMVLPRSKFRSCPWLKPGSLVRLHSRGGKEIEVVAREVNDESVTVDANHPLAGMTLSFEMTVLSIEDSRKSR
jgi:FKBP-type peptidyl-prolyl cis-trans isomerase 2